MIDNQIVAPGQLPEKQGLYDPANEKDACGVGFVANIKGVPSHQIMLDAYHINSRMDHRGGCGFEENTGDGAGILCAQPHSLYKELADELKINLPAPGEYAVGNIFLPTNADERHHCQAQIEAIIADEGQTFLAWRNVPIDFIGADVGPAALSAQPAILQLFVAANQLGESVDSEAFERKLYVIRRRFTESLRRNSDLKEAHMVYACSLSSRVIVYKGMLTPGQLFPFYEDLQDTRLPLTWLWFTLASAPIPFHHGIGRNLTGI